MWDFIICLVISIVCAIGIGMEDGIKGFFFGLLICPLLYFIRFILPDMIADHINIDFGKKYMTIKKDD